MTIKSKTLSFLTSPAVLAVLSIALVAGVGTIYHFSHGGDDPALPITSPKIDTPPEPKADIDLLEWQRDQLQTRVYLQQLSLASLAGTYPYLSTDPINSNVRGPFRGELRYRISKIREMEAQIRQIETQLARAGR